MTRVRVPGKEVCLAHIINTSQTPVYQNLGLHISVHEGGSHRRIHWSDPFYPMGSSCRCCGCGNEKRRCRNWIYGSLLRFLILTGGLSQVQTAVEEVVRFFMKIWDFAPVRSIKTKRTGDMTI